jgi:hypothetical protein
VDTAEVVEDILIQFGAKGMHWGIRKEKTAPSGSLKPQGVTMGKDGSVSIKKGSNIQRLVADDGTSRKLKDMTYASINKYDNAKYVKLLGGDSFFGGGRTEILSMKTIKTIKIPSTLDSVKIHSDLMINNSNFRKNATNTLYRPIGSRDLRKITEDPTGKTAKKWYNNTNYLLANDDAQTRITQHHFEKALKAKGYDGILDQNDISLGHTKAPIIIFSPEKSLKIVTTTHITDSIRKANKQQLKSYKKNGKDWVDKELYGS